MGHRACRPPWSLDSTVSWVFTSEAPRELRSHGYDATVWEWSLRENRTGSETRTLVLVSGTAMEVADEQLPAVVARAKATRGRSAIEPFLSWVVPPRRIELDTATERPRPLGGIRQSAGSSEERLQEISRWFAERGIDLELDRRGEHWTAIMLPRGVRVGSADYGVGDTPAEAAEDALRRYEIGGMASLGARREI